MIISGFPCPASSWQSLFPSDQADRHVSLANLLEATPTAGIRGLSQTASKLIELHRPDSLILHDLGVVIGLLGLMRARKRDPSIRPSITIFNGAFRGFNVLLATHPFKIQFLSFSAVTKLVESAGGKMDSRLRPHFGKIKGLYRQLIAASLLERVQALTGFRRKLSIELGSRILILGSSNDPFIPAEALRALRDDFKGAQLEMLEYGHFPYSGDLTKIRERVKLFEGAA